MKRLKLLLILLVGPILAQAQIGISSASRIDIDFGVKLGANFAKLNGTGWDDGYKAGFHGGIYGNIHSKKIGVHTEVFFSQSRYATTGEKFYQVYKGIPGFFVNAADSAINGDITVSSLNIPLLLHLKLMNNAWIQIGPQFSTVVSVDDKDALLTDAEGMFSSGDVSGVIGLWMNLPLNLNIGARYVMGFSELRDHPSITDSWKNRSIQVHIGYNIF